MTGDTTSGDSSPVAGAAEDRHVSDTARQWLRGAELAVVCCVIGGGFGLAAAAMPSGVRVLGLFAVAVGVAVAVAVRWTAAGIGVRRPAVVIAAAAFTALLTVVVYIDRSVHAFAAAEAPKNGRERVAEILLEQLPDDVRGDIPVDPLPRWLRWRVSGLGLTGAWPAVVGLVEAAACVAGAASVAARAAP